MSENHESPGAPPNHTDDAGPAGARLGGATGLLTDLIAKAAARELGEEPAPARVQGHHGAVLLGSVAYETAVTRFDALEPRFRKLACLQAARIAGCPW